MASLAGFELCCNPQQDSWILTCEDYANEGGGFRWNEFELMALEALTDPRDREEIAAFWDFHFPFMFAVHSDYDYLAVRLTPNDFGSIVHGYAPELEDPSIIAPSFSALSQALAVAATSAHPEYPLSVFLHEGA